MLGSLRADRARAAQVSWISVLGALAFVSLAPSMSMGADVVRVEEVWELVVETTDANSTAPQIATVFSPTGDVDGLHATFELNHKSTPDFVPGGLHLQLWDGEEHAANRKFPTTHVMRTNNEVVRWKQRMVLVDGVLTLEIVDGTSSTWGSFGGQGYLRFSGEVNVANLNGYNPTVSVKHSGVTYAANRVRSLVLKSVKVVTANGQEHVDQTDRVVHQK